MQLFLHMRMNTNRCGEVRRRETRSELASGAVSGYGFFMSSSSRAWRISSLLWLSLLWAVTGPVLQAGGLNFTYRDGNWAASVRLSTRAASGWSFRCAPGLVTRPCGYYPGIYGYSYGYVIPYSPYGFDYGYAGYTGGEYYGVRYLPSTTPIAAGAPAPAPGSLKAAPAASALDPDAELKAVLAELSAQRAPLPAQPGTEAELDPRIVVPEALSSMVGLPEIQPVAFKKVR